jgi:hypothetical protein
VINGCSEATAPAVPEREAYVRWIEATWTREALRLRILGSAGCAGLKSLDVEILPDTTAPTWSDVIIRPHAYPRPEQYCSAQLLDTVLLLHKPAIVDGVTVWAPFPWEPGLRGFVTTIDSPYAFDVGGLVRIDTVSYGCPVVRPLVYWVDSLQYAIGLISTWSPVQLAHGDVVFLGGDVYPLSSGCNGLPSLNIRRLELNPGE